MSRSRPIYAGLIALVITLGLTSRSGIAAQFPAIFRDDAGDTLWALMVFLSLGFLRPPAKTQTLALLALSIAFSVELSQLYQADWLNHIRATRIGALALGSGFLWSDLACYALGILVGARIEKLLLHSPSP